MKKTYSLLLLVFCTQIALSQTGTIKIAKPEAPKTDTTKSSKETRLYFIPQAGINYTFKSNNKLGYEAGFSLSSRSGTGSLTCLTAIGIQYAIEEEYRTLSAYNMKSHSIETPITHSQIHSEYLKLRFRAGGRLNMGRRTNLRFALELKPEYLLQVKDAEHRLTYSDFKQYNLAGAFIIGGRIKRHFGFEFTYSKDFYENLKDRSIYNANGGIMGKQRTKTNLVSFSVEFIF